WTDSLPTGINTVIHLAQAVKRDFPADVDLMYNINVNATFQLVEWARNSKVEHFMFTSTGNVYKRQEQAFVETDLCEPDSFYGGSKLAAENIIRQYSNELKITILRLFGVYGHGQESMMMANLIESVKLGNEIYLDGGKGLEITPIYIDDLMKVISYFTEFGQSQHLVYNVAGDERLTIHDIVTEITSVIEEEPRFTNRDKVPGSLCANINRLTSETGIREYTKFEQGIRRTIGISVN
ncbi:MAG: NAD(P)-dependent oxidoreductase, partial [Bacteroidetes bacterium]|nr:NAD(P)-dependent oxidoreductase [Bacteroidota bacterium]